jgi:hypothetical protein
LLGALHPIKNPTFRRGRAIVHLIQKLMNQICVSAGQIARPNLATLTSCPTTGQFDQSVIGVKNDTQPRKSAKNPGPAGFQAPNRKKTGPHARRYAEDVREKWEFGDYSPSGYLAEIFSATKAEGLPIVIKNIQAFCEKWGIGRRTFFRAKASLVARGRLREVIDGSLIVWLIPQKGKRLYDDNFDTMTTDMDANYDTEGDNYDTEGDNFDTETPPKGLQESPFEAPPDLSSDLIQINKISLSDPIDPGERDLIINSSEEIEEEFKEWMISKAKQLPKRPTFIHQWAKAQMKKPENRKDFLKDREAMIERRNFPPAPIDAPKTLSDYVFYPLAQFSEEEQRANTLARLQAKWRMDGRLRSAAIAEAAKQGFIVTAIGIDEV